MLFSTFVLATFLLSNAHNLVTLPVIQIIWGSIGWTSRSFTTTSIGRIWEIKLNEKIKGNSSENMKKQTKKELKQRRNRRKSEKHNRISKKRKERREERKKKKERKKERKQESKKEINRFNKGQNLNQVVFLLLFQLHCPSRVHPLLKHWLLRVWMALLGGFQQGVALNHCPRVYIVKIICLVST